MSKADPEELLIQTESYMQEFWKLNSHLASKQQIDSIVRSAYMAGWYDGGPAYLRILDTAKRAANV